MTGFGNATTQSDCCDVSVELKAVNNRYLKLSMRLPDMVTRFEPDIEKLIRSAMARGSVQLSVRIRLHGRSSGYAIDKDVLSGYVAQLAELEKDGLSVAGQPPLSDLLQLPGVVTESEVSIGVVETIWPQLQETLAEALKQFSEFRSTEGESMRIDLKSQVELIEQQVSSVAEKAPGVVAEYREKLLDRVRKALDDTEARIDDSDVIRDVALFADRCDINEEITRLGSHIDQFYKFLDSPQSMGRKLEFVGQEMFREINTIGSKANNVEIAHCVVEMKASIERIREVLQNVE